MNLEEPINIEDEYKKLANNNDKKVYSNENIVKVNSGRKLTCGILKRSKTKKHSPIKDRKKSGCCISNSIKWDNAVINEQENYRKSHPLDKNKLKESKAKYFLNAIIDKDDEYMKGLNKVNQMNPNDALITKIFNALNENIVIKRNKSCFDLRKNKNLNKMRNFYKITEREKIFDDSLGDEQKLTLKNTLFNKMAKEVIVN